MLNEQQKLTIDVKEGEIDFKRVNALFAQSHIYVFIVFCLAIISSSIMWKSTNSKVFFYWIVAMSTVLACRFIAIFRFNPLIKKAPIEKNKLIQQENILCAFLTMTGLNWFVLLILVDTYHAGIFETGILFSCIATLASVSIQIYSHSFKAYVSFATAALFPSSIFLIFSLETSLQVIGHIGFYFFIMTIFASWTLSQFTLDGIKRELENEYLMEQMHFKNAELLELNQNLEEDIRRQSLMETKMASEKQKIEVLNAKLLAMSSLDGLTGIANQYRFNEFLNKEWIHSSRNHLPISLLICNIDNLQNYNEKFGIQRGDRAICILAGLLEDFARCGTDIAARLSGDKFAILFASSTNIEDTRSIAERLRLSFYELDLPNPNANGTKHLSISVGVASMAPTPENEPAELIEKTEAALAKAKKEGRNRVCASTTLTLASNNIDIKS